MKLDYRHMFSIVMSLLYNVRSHLSPLYVLSMCGILIRVSSLATKTVKNVYRLNS